MYSKLIEKDPLSFILFVPLQHNTEKMTKTPCAIPTPRYSHFANPLAILTREEEF